MFSPQALSCLCDCEESTIEETAWVKEQWGSWGCGEDTGGTSLNLDVLRQQQSLSKITGFEVFNVLFCTGKGSSSSKFVCGRQSLPIKYEYVALKILWNRNPTNCFLLLQIAWKWKKCLSGLSWPEWLFGFVNVRSSVNAPQRCSLAQGLPGNKRLVQET